MQQRLYIVLIGLSSFFGQIALVTLAKLESASSTALLRKSLDVILAFIFQILIFQVLQCVTHKKANLIQILIIFLGYARNAKDSRHPSHLLSRICCKSEKNVQKGDLGKISNTKIFVLFLALENKAPFSYK